MAIKAAAHYFTDNIHVYTMTVEYIVCDLYRNKKFTSQYFCEKVNTDKSVKMVIIWKSHINLFSSVPSGVILFCSFCRVGEKMQLHEMFPELSCPGLLTF